MLTDNELQRMRYQNESRKSHSRYRREVNLAYGKAAAYHREMLKAQKESAEYRKVLRPIPNVKHRYKNFNEFYEDNLIY